MINNVRGCLLGGAIGDALGYQIEFKRNIKEKEITRFNGKGIISDDTQMTLFTANSLIWRETRGFLRGIAPSPVDAIYCGYLDWLDTQNNKKREDIISWLSHIPELNIPRAPGNTCISALSSRKKGTIDNPINDSKGCGGVMRVAPIGIYVRDSKLAGQIGADASALTHGHPLGIIPSYVLSSMINLIIHSKKSIKEALDISIEQMIDSKLFDSYNIKLFTKLIDKAVQLSESNVNDLDAIKQLGEGWVAEEALAIAIYSSLKYQNSFEDAAVCSINHDGDSDSTGSITGNIVGAYLGYDSIPDYFIDNLELNDIIIEIADDLSTELPILQDLSEKDSYWLSKYLYCCRDENLKTRII